MYKNETISVVVPSKNEEKNLLVLLPKLKKINMIDEFIVIDGHSKDGTKKAAKKFEVKYSLDNKKGKGAALRIAANKAKSDIIIFIDADCSHNPKDIERLIHCLVNEKMDLVIGSRSKGGSDELSGTLGNTIRRLGSEIINVIINKRFGVKLTDYHNGFRAIRRDVINNLGLKEDTFTIEQEMAIKALKKGYKVGEIPTHEYKRMHGTSNINIVRIAPKYFWTTLKYCFFK